MDNLLKFKGSWRDYQKRILDNLSFHLRDKKLHVVAAPGAGKTTLGIEVISRINRPTLILTPTNTIKNQWKDRICCAFLDEKDYEIVSTNIREPKFITVTTYQALLAAFCGKNDDEEPQTYDENEEDIDADSITSSKRFNDKKADEVINILKSAKVSLLCFDEAHHLRKEWWKALTYLNDNLEPEQTLALTATPPYDADLNEWNRYEELCGEIDEVISIPELVQNNDLCPHQDFICFSKLRDSEKEMIKKHELAVSQFVDKITKDTKLIKYLSRMSFLINTNDEVEKILDAPEFYVSIASLLHNLGFKISKEFPELFNAKEKDIPKFDSTQAKIFLNGFLITHTSEFKGLEDKIEDYLAQAKRAGLIHNKKIVLNESVKIQRQIASSTGKMDSIVEIVQTETESLGKDLRMVILADYIKDKDTDNTHLGVIPIWRTLKNKFSSEQVSLGVLCGSLILLPKDKQNDFNTLLNDNNIDLSSVAISEYGEDENYIRITPKESAKNVIVSLITDMFNRGHITILVGTQALLGEGWDAPSINSLILSSTVSSYMLSNQMRGRAIRIDKNNPDKISNIWHLATIGIPSEKSFSEILFTPVATDLDQQDEVNSLFYDYKQLTKRFEGFEAPSYYDKHEIRNGLERLFTAKEIQKLITEKGEKAFSEMNARTFALAKNRQQTKNWWNNALNLGYNNSKMKLRTGVETEKFNLQTLTYNGYRQICMTLFSLMLAIFLGLMPNRSVNNEALTVLFGLYLIIAVIFLCIFIRIGLKYLKTGSVSGVMKQVGIVMLESLSYQGYIKSSLKIVGLEVTQDEAGVYVSCANLPTEENNLFIKCMREFLDPVENPRYLFVRHGNLLGQKQTDYFSIPAILSNNKNDVNIFKSLWEKYIGECEIIYTRNTQGRITLLSARKNAFSNMNRPKSKRLSKWQ